MRKDISNILLWRRRSLDASFPYAPLTITFDGETSDATPDFDVAAALGSVALGDTLRWQQATNSGFTANLIEVDTVVTQPMIDNLAVTPAGFTISADGNYWWRAHVLRGGIPINDWSNVETSALDVAPVISTSATASVAENSTLSIALAANQTVTWSIVGGADQAKFEISGTTLRWASNGTKDYESPNDADTNNTYIVTVRATAVSDAQTTDKTITVTVTDVVEAAGFSLSFLTHAEDTGAHSTFTFSSQTFGGTDASRKIVVGVAGRHYQTGVINSVTIGGVSATQVVAANNNTFDYSCRNEIWIADVPTGASGDVVVVWNQTNDGCAIALWSLIGAGVGSPVTGVDNNSPGGTSLTVSKALTVPSGGAVVAIASVGSGFSPGTTGETPTNLTEDADQEVLTGSGGGSYRYAAGHNTTASGSTTFTFTWGGASPPTGWNPSGAFAAWGP